MKKRDGFTLAEVLVTIGILGVVAALTIPVLMGDFNKQTWTGGLKTSVNTITNGFDQMMAMEGVSNLEDTTLWNQVISRTVIASDNAVRRELGKYFSITKMESNPTTGIYPVYTIQGNGTLIIDQAPVFTLSNNMKLYARLYNATTNKKSRAECLEIKDNGGNLCNKLADIYIDVNGEKAPNTLGKDIYSFYLGSDGRLFPIGGKDVYLFDETEEWRTHCSGKEFSAACGDSRVLTARVIEQGYKITY